MRKVFVAGFVSLGLLVGCMNTNNNQTAAERLGTSRYLCETDQGIQDETPEMTACMTKMMNQQTSNNRMSGEAMIRVGGAMYSCAIYGTRPDPITGICSPPPPKQEGNVYDKSGRHIGTYVEN